MMRHLMTLVLSGILGSILLAGNAEACHRKRCSCAAPVACVTPAPVVCVQPVVRVKMVRCAKPAPCVKPVACVQPAPCVKPVACAQPAPCGQPVACTPRPKKCCGLLAGLFHKKPVVTVACATPVVYSGYALPSGQYMATPQASAQR
jgi:hypothetical protein